MPAAPNRESVKPVMADDAVPEAFRAGGTLDESYVRGAVPDLLGDGVAVGGGEHHLGWGLPAVRAGCRETSPKLLGGGTLLAALTWAFASSKVMSSDYMPDQRKLPSW